MATSKKIKSAIRSKGSSQREFSKNLADVRSSLQESDFSNKLFDLKSKERASKYDLAYSAIDLGSTLASSLEQRSELKSNIKEFEGSLKDTQEMRIEKKPSLIDVFKKKGSLSSYLQGDQYYLGDKSLGSKYDVAALGSEIKSKREASLLMSNSITNDTLIEDLNLEEPKNKTTSDLETDIPQKTKYKDGKEFLKEYPKTSNAIKEMLDPTPYINPDSNPSLDNFLDENKMFENQDFKEYELINNPNKNNMNYVIQQTGLAKKG